MHPSAADAESRQRQRRLLGLLLTGPFFAASAAALFLPTQFGASLTIVAIAAILATGWLIAMASAATGKELPAAGAGLAAATAVTAGLVAAAGGAASPAALCVVALVLEPFWLYRSRRSLFVGVGAAIAALAAQAAIGASFVSTVTVAPVWQWLVPMAYAATFVVRMQRPRASETRPDTTGMTTRIEEIIGAAVVQIGRNNEVSQVSERARQLFGLAPQLLLGQGLFERIHVSDRVAYLCALANLREGQGAQHVELRIRLPHEDEADYFRSFVLDLAAPVAAEEAIVAVIRDNDDVAELRRRIEKAGERIEKADLTRDRFLAAVSHELRTPLNAIIGFSDILAQEMFGGFQDPRQKEYVGLIRDSGHHLLGVVNAMLDMSKIESGAYVTHPESFSFKDAVDMCRAMLGMQATTKGLTMVEEVAPGTGQLIADRRAVQQILINLVSNAIKFTPQGGQVAIGAKRIGSRLHFWVADNGIGIAEADLDRLGRPFVQVQNDYTRQFEGTGLGLALVKGMVALHDGEMTIESAPGEGTTVFISLPVDGTAEEVRKGELLPMPAPKPKEEANGTLRKTA